MGWDVDTSVEHDNNWMTHFVSFDDNGFIVVSRSNLLKKMISTILINIQNKVIHAYVYSEWQHKGIKISMS